MDEEIKISDETRHKLDCFKPIVDLILKEELTFENYVGLVLSRGINTMIRDIIPKDVEILLKSMYNFLMNTLTQPLNSLLIY